MSEVMLTTDVELDSLKKFTKELEERIDIIHQVLVKLIRTTNQLTNENIVLKEKINSLIVVSNLHSQTLNEVTEAMSGYTKPLDDDDGGYIH